MSDKQVHKVLAEAFIAEGVDRVYTLMGDANMHWSIALAQRGVQLVHARHEHSAVAMADGYARFANKVGVASVTCGPGYTQIATALTVAVRNGTPMIVFAGDTPFGEPFHNQHFDQAPLAAATGAAFVSLRNVNLMLHDLRQAFYTARHERRPVVVSVPLDLQLDDFPWITDYEPSISLLPKRQRVQPDPEIVSEAAAMIADSDKPIIIAGRGAIHAKGQLEDLAEKSGALLTTTLCAKGLFDGVSYDAGVAGAFAHKAARELFSEADLIIGIGAGLGYYTTEGGYLYPNARVIQVDVQPKGLWQGLKVADLHVIADAASGASALTRAVVQAGAAKPRYRSVQVQQALAEPIIDPKAYQAAANTVDPRRAMEALDAAIPKDWNLVTGTAHFFNWVTHLKGRPADRYFITHAFGAIGQGLPTAIGIATAPTAGETVLIEGDGSFLMHIQELEVLARQEIKLLVLIFNDGAYSAETHKLAGQGYDPAESIFGRPDLAAIAKGFGLACATVRTLGELRNAITGHIANPLSTVVDIHIDGNIPSIQYRRLFFGEA